MVATPTNRGKLIAKHQIKFIHGRTVDDLQNDVNRWLETNMGSMEVKDINFELGDSGARIAVIHYYEHIRMEPTQPMQAETEQPASPTASYIRKNPKTYNPGGTQHVAPSQNTPATHNKAAPTPGAELAAKQQADKLAQINSNLTSDLDQMKPVVNMPANATMGKSDKNIEIPESKYEVTEEVSIVVDPALEGAEQAIETPLPPAPEPTEPDADEDMVAGEHDDEDNTPIDETSIPTNEELGLEKKDTGWQEVQKKIDDVTPPRQK